MMVETKRAKGVRGEASGAKRSTGRGAGVALACAAAVLGAGAFGGCQSPGEAGPGEGGPVGDASAETAGEVETTGAACEGEGCTAPSPSAGRMRSCPVGSPNCDPDVNGTGVYIAEYSMHCLPTPTPGVRLCPETFINGPNGGVSLRLYPNKGTYGPIDLPITATFETAGFGPMVGERLKSITTEQGRLVVKYTKLNMTTTPLPGQTPTPTPTPVPGPIVTPQPTASPLVVTDAQLPYLKLNVTVDIAPSTASFSYQLSFTPVGEVLADGPEPRAVIKRFHTLYQMAQGGSTNWTEAKIVCANIDGKVATSFLGGYQVNNKSAKVTANANAVTMSCETGAIDTCMKWGYAPWAGEGGDKRAALFGACLQAKRAAYFVGKGEYGSYTKSGTPILLKDAFGVHRAEINTASLEASWSVNGAKCFTWANRRRPDMTADEFPHDITLPTCEGAGDPPLLFTGKTTQSDTTD